jgi:hypothetical protein
MTKELLFIITVGALAWTMGMLVWGFISLAAADSREKLWRPVGGVAIGLLVTTATLIVTNLLYPPM